MTFHSFFPRLYSEGGMMQMKAIRKRRNGYAVLLIISVLLTAWFAVKLIIETTLVFGATSIALLVLLVRQYRRLSNASLIWDNRILTVPSAVISIMGGKEKVDTGEIVVSTFGILSGSKIYKWG